MSAFPGKNYQAPRSWTQQAYQNLIYYNKPDKGGHFAAWEQPQVFAAEVRAGPEATAQITSPRRTPRLATRTRVMHTSIRGAC